MTDLILGIESSCDETSVGIVKDGNVELANVITSQIKSHQRFGGVVPEVASRHHVEYINYCLIEAMKKADLNFSDLNGIAVTYGPGLAGCLLVGLTAAKTISCRFKLPLLAVNHMAGHIYATNLVRPMEFPALALLVSGGHTEFVLMNSELDFQIVGTTLDDAVGEAYDKVGRLIGFNYPAGKSIDAAAQKGNSTYDLPRPMLKSPDLNFSFSGLKTAVRTVIDKDPSISVEDLAASFQEAVIDVLITKTKKALQLYPVKEFIIAGGVAANSGLRERMFKLIEEEFPRTKLVIPPLRLCGDNGAMIASFGHVLYQNKIFSNLDIDSDPSLNFSFTGI